MARGAFIVIEGLDRSGKTTQIAALYEHLISLGKKVEQIKFPDRTTAIGKMIDAYLKSQADIDDHAIHLLFSANRWESVSKILKLLEEGTTILCDRYAFSGIAFSASKGLPFDWCKTPDVGLPEPDMVLFLDVSPEVAQERGGYGEERYEKEEMQKRVREEFVRVRDCGGRSLRWEVVNAGRAKDQVELDIRNATQALFNGVEGPIRRLWAP
ncbi:thymidylate kinase [Cylindrobasidium torrendii FP15055 ss-10]|uniref:Thymidylate kinase n=1 Tax=Cylindrobasidium torrendii FP15055 ss-10 TaxID=1314674 RepID=A0A0D7BNP2_9AGAR|nr:thymidylate kinase [Cylindrobasidium torrendii FP15055 ss-10]